MSGIVSDDRAQQLRRDRGRVYGNPAENHDGIAQMWASLLAPHWRDIRALRPLPRWVVALLMVGLKLNRMRRVFHEDNFDDLGVYLGFAKDWQREAPGAPAAIQRRIYVAGPYSAQSEEGRLCNVERAAEAGAECLRRGHLVHVPHTCTAPLDRPGVTYEHFMAVDLDLIRNWADAVLFLGSSPGADRELACAQACNLDVYLSLDEVPDLRG